MRTDHRIPELIARSKRSRARKQPTFHLRSAQYVCVQTDQLYCFEGHLRETSERAHMNCYELYDAAWSSKVKHRVSF